MFDSLELKNYLETSQTINSKAFVVAEWNLNDPENIKQVGNYRNRWNDSNSYYYNIISQWDQNDVGNWWTNATNADDSIEGPYDSNDEPTVFITEDKRFKYLYSLDDCFTSHRPRSGINYPLYFDGKYLDGLESVNRPRYYLGHINNKFKYWTSYRKIADPCNRFSYPDITKCGVEEFTGEVGISKTDTVNNIYYIWDAAPFVVYKDQIPTNKIVIKMQTNIGTEENSNVVDISGNIIPDPLYGDTNSSRPRNWAVQVLKDNTWTTIKEFGENETRADDSPIVGPDGYVELVYGVKFPESLLNGVSNTRFLGTITSTSFLPNVAYPGDYYYVTSNSINRGLIYFWSSTQWESFYPEYGWNLNDNYSDIGRYLLTDFTNPESFVTNQVFNPNDPTDLIGGQTVYREFEYISGIRLVIKTMNKVDSTFDLIEISPRLQANITDSVVYFNIAKSTGKIDDVALPVGALQASTGSIEIFDYDFAFRENNSNSIISKLTQQDISFSFYDLIEEEINNYYIPIKKLYTESKKPDFNDVATVKYELRDTFYLFENIEAPQIMLTNVSLSYAIATLLDLIGFSNYVFKRNSEYAEPVIPYFFIAPDQNVAEILNKLAVATQSAMFFDEYNNFVVMYKEYLLDATRPVDIVLDGNSNIPNIVNISSSEKKVYNDGVINYTERYLQRSVGSLSQVSVFDRDQNWIYLPALLWEVSGDDKTKSRNEKVSQQSAYALTAMPLNTTLNNTHPIVVQRKITNNIIDVGDNVTWLPRYKGYLYANGEIIKYDAVEYSVQGVSDPVWISSNDEYQKYFGALPFNGKMYPTGLIRIYSEPYYETIDGKEYLKNGDVGKSGRGQFGTSLATHNAGLSSSWSDSSYLRGIKMSSDMLFNAKVPPSTVLGVAGVNNAGVQSAERKGIIKNFMRDVSDSDASNYSLPLSDRGMIQASAFVFNGPNLAAGEVPRDWVSYVYKPLDVDFKHFGTRMRIIGKLEAAGDVQQNPSGSMSFYSSLVSGESLILSGGAGGIGIGVNPDTNNGYFIEMIALTNTNLSDLTASSSFSSDVAVHNIIFYKIVRDSRIPSNIVDNTNPVDSYNDLPASPTIGWRYFVTSESTHYVYTSSGWVKDVAIPIKLWGGLADVIVDSGTFAGQQRMVGEENTTVYDLSIEYKDIGSARRFYIFINGRQVATVDDSAPIPLYSNMCLFVRGASNLMFENVFALRQNIAENSEGNVIAANTIPDAFDMANINHQSNTMVGGTLDALDFKKYGISGFVQSSYLTGLSPANSPSHNMYYEEFGTIMREASYFDIKYDKAYPALTAQISPLLNGMPGYVVSGFETTPYGAKFLIFNVMDKAISLDETNGNYLRIQGVTFTQNTTHEFKMDDYYNEISNLSDPEIINNIVIRSPRDAEEKFKNIKISRKKYGKSGWTLDTDYIQSQDSAFNLMNWIADKTTRPRQLIGVELFSNPMIQLGDIVSVNYTKDGVQTYTENTKKFVVYNIEYSRGSDGPTMNIYLSEV